MPGRSIAQNGTQSNQSLGDIIAGKKELMIEMPYTVTRQRQWPEGTPVVEISAGGLDYTNPDALATKYPGEFQAFDDPREAVEVTIAICRAWRRDEERRAKVAYGATGGMTMPFSPCTYEEARQWAKKRYEALPKCDRCGGLLPERPYRLYEPGFEDARYCREYCAEERYREVSLEDRVA